jgi:archaellum biogenesis ATPase FlaH
MVLGNASTGKSITVNYLLIGFSESEQQTIRTMANKAGKEALEGIGKN